jgi:hypothetical protein
MNNNNNTLNNKLQVLKHKLYHMTDHMPMSDSFVPDMVPSKLAHFAQRCGPDVCVRDSDKLYKI